MIEIRPFQSEYLFPVLSISNQVFGKNYLRQSELASVEIHLAMKDQEVVGFITTKKLNKRDFIIELGLESAELLFQIPEDKNILLYKSIGVSPLHQNQGIGSQMVEWVNQNVVMDDMVLAEIRWQRKSITSKGGMTERYGSVPVLTLKNYWKGEASKEDFECPECKRPDCSCEAIIYLKLPN